MRMKEEHLYKMANPRKFSEKIALHTQKQAEETAAFRKIMEEVTGATKTNKDESPADPQWTNPLLVQQSTPQSPQLLSTPEVPVRSGSMPNMHAALDTTNTRPSVNVRAALSNLALMRQGRDPARMSRSPMSGSTRLTRMPSPCTFTQERLAVEPTQRRNSFISASESPASFMGAQMLSRSHNNLNQCDPSMGGTIQVSVANGTRLHHSRLHNARADCQPYLLSPPSLESAWRRTASDSALHQSALDFANEGNGRQAPVMNWQPLGNRTGYEHNNASDMQTPFKMQYPQPMIDPSHQMRSSPFGQVQNRTLQHPMHIDNAWSLRAISAECLNTSSHPPNSPYPPQMNQPEQTYARQSLIEDFSMDDSNTNQSVHSNPFTTGHTNNTLMHQVTQRTHERPSSCDLAKQRTMMSPSVTTENVPITFSAPASALNSQKNSPLSVQPSPVHSPPAYANRISTSPMPTGPEYSSSLPNSTSIHPPPQYTPPANQMTTGSSPPAYNTSPNSVGSANGQLASPPPPIIQLDSQPVQYMSEDAFQNAQSPHFVQSPLTPARPNTPALEDLLDLPYEISFDDPNFSLLNQPLLSPDDASGSAEKNSNICQTNNQSFNVSNASKKENDVESPSGNSYPMSIDACFAQQQTTALVTGMQQFNMGNSQSSSLPKDQNTQMRNSSESIANISSSSDSPSQNNGPTTPNNIPEIILTGPSVDQPGNTNGVSLMLNELDFLDLDDLQLCSEYCNEQEFKFD